MRSGSVLPVLLRMASPSALAFFVQAGVSSTEIWYVSKLGTDALAAIALVFPCLMLLQMLANGAMGGAVNSAIARSLGGGDRARAEALIWHALIIAAGSGVAFFLAWQLAGESMLRMFGVNAAILHEAGGYGSIVFAGSGILWTTALLGAVFRGMGDMKYPAALMVLGAGIQIALSGALVLGWFGLPRLGIAGAAASVITVSALNAALLAARLTYGNVAVRMRLRACRVRAGLFADIMSVGLPASLSPVFTVLTILLVNGLVSGFGSAALGGYGIASRIEFLLIPMVFGLGTAMTAMVGTNAGAGNVRRAERIGWIGGACAAGATGVVGLVLAVFPQWWMDVFTRDPDVWQSGVSYLRTVGPAFVFQGLGLSLYFASQGAGTVVWPVIATVLRFVLGVGGATAGVALLDLDLGFVYGCLALGMTVYGLVTAGSVRMGAWRRM